ncbi:MAG: hypothetical protein JXA19_04570 [Anaerolineales bacterium]|nr:hypothetical protein [Anaerolineales bacterium]
MFHKGAQFTQEKLFRDFTIYIVLYFLFYTPVILFVHMGSMIGFLMIPNTIMYMINAYLG